MILSQSQPLSERDNEYRIYIFYYREDFNMETKYLPWDLPLKNYFRDFLFCYIIYFSYTRKQVDRVPNSLNI